VSTAAWLTPDPAVPQRDALLDPRVVADRLGRLLGIDGPVVIERCERLRVNYQIGKSLRVLHRVEAAGKSWTIAARMFRNGRGERADEEVRQSSVPCGVVRPIFYDVRLHTVFWVFPNDRKITGLAALANGSLSSNGSLPVAWKASRLVAYAPEKSATLACVDDNGAAVAYAKFFAGDEGERHFSTYRALSAAAERHPSVRLPRALAYVREHRVLIVEAIAGRRMADQAVDVHATGDAARLGTALAGFHALTHADPRPFTRFAGDRLIDARRLVARVRPDVTALADVLVRELIARRAAGEHDGDAPVCLHGDVHPKNAIITDRTVALIDVEDLAIGPAAADLGSFLALLLYLRRGARLDDARHDGAARAFLSGYASVRPLPPPAALRWHTAAALLVERALRAVTRVRPLGLLHLPELLNDAHALLTEGRDDDLEPRALP
jgi:Ser/Thr protein kinase RdoA (MazF antagonist)